MIELQLTIQNEHGLHARPAGILVKEMNQFQSKLEICFNEKKVNGKSLMSLLTLGLKQGSQIHCRLEGVDETPMAERLSALCEKRFEA